jgi:hypothetical protein
LDTIEFSVREIGQSASATVAQISAKIVLNIRRSSAIYLLEQLQTTIATRRWEDWKGKRCCWHEGRLKLRNER